MSLPMTSIMKQNKLQNIFLYILGIVFVGCLIQAAGFLKNDRLVFPSLPEILRALVRLLLTGQTYRLIGTTLGHMLLTMLVSTIAGVSIGLWEGIMPRVHTFLTPLMVMLRSIPMLILIVILMVLTKYRYVPLIGSTLILIPLLSEATYEGCRRIEPELLDVYRLNAPLNGMVLRTVYLPLLAGYLRQAYINAVGMGIKLVISTEYLVQTRNSLGKAIYASSYFNTYEEIYAYALIMILLVLLVCDLPLALFPWLANRRERKSRSSNMPSRD